MATNNNNKALNVPHLRFPEFTEEWKNTSLGKIGKTFNGLTGKSGSDFGQGFPYITYKSIFDNSKIDISRVEYVEITDVERKKETQNKVQYGDVFFTTSSETPDEVGMSSVLLDEIKDCYLNSFCFGYRLNSLSKTVPEYMRFYLRSQTIRKKMFVLAQGSTRFNISKSEVMGMSINIPEIEEQRKIANLLTLLDDRIATQNKIIEDLKKLKSAISKQVFAQKPNGWNRLDTLFSKGKAGGTPTSTNKEYYNGEIPFLSINDITKQGKYVQYTENHLSQSGLENSSAWMVPEYSLIMSMYASVGLVTINEIPITTSQAMFAMQLKDKDLLDYLYYYLSYFKYRYIHKYLETGTQSNINADIVRGIMIPTYGHSRNMEIASTLQGFDAKIDNELSVLELFNRQKNYLLSQMFI